MMNFEIRQGFAFMNLECIFTATNMTSLNDSKLNLNVKISNECANLALLQCIS